MVPGRLHFRYPVVTAAMTEAHPIVGLEVVRSTRSFARIILYADGMIDRDARDDPNSGTVYRRPDTLLFVTPSATRSTERVRERRARPASRDAMRAVERLIVSADEADQRQPNACLSAFTTSAIPTVRDPFDLTRAF